MAAARHDEPGPGAREGGSRGRIAPCAGGRAGESGRAREEQAAAAHGGPRERVEIPVNFHISDHHAVAPREGPHEIFDGAADFLEGQERHRAPRMSREDLDEIGRCPGIVGIAAGGALMGRESMDGEDAVADRAPLSGECGADERDRGAGCVE